MARLMTILGLIFVSTISTHAQYTLVVDGDGVIGNGPDTLIVSGRDTLDAQLWVLGTRQTDVLGVDFTVCRPSNVLLEQYSDSIGGAWTISPPVIQADSCDVFSAFDFTFADLRTVPIHVGTASYVAPQDFTGGVLIGSIELSGFFDTQLEPSIVASIPLVLNAAENTSWTELKARWRY